VESLAAAAEEAVPQTGDLAGAAPGVAVAAAGVRWLQDTVPFCGLLLVVFLQQHLLPILAFSWCTFVLHHANARVRLWLPLLQAPPGGAGVLLVAAEIVTQLLALLLLCGRDLVSQLLLRLPDWALDGATLFGVLLAVLSADVVVRFVGMLLKLGSAAAKAGATPTTRPRHVQPRVPQARCSRCAAPPACARPARCVAPSPCSSSAACSTARCCPSLSGTRGWCTPCGAASSRRCWPAST